MIERILKRIIPDKETLSINQFKHEEDESCYNVWKVNYPDQCFVLKQAKEQELALYQTFFNSPSGYAPTLYATTNYDNSDYILIEYISGTNLTHCSRKNLICAIDALIKMQDAYWMANDDLSSFQMSLNRRENRAEYIRDPYLETVYNAFLREFSDIPRTLCHDDLLPFNVIVSNNRAVFIDWEVGGILPYPTPLARLIAHSNDEDAFFFIKNEDKLFAIQYYYDQFIKYKGIDYATYRRSVDLFLFYEYCEWIYVGNKYGNTENKRFQKYLKLAVNQAKIIGF